MKQNSQDLCWKFLDPAHRFFLWSLTMYELHNRNASIGICNHRLYFARFCAGGSPTLKIANKNKKLCQVSQPFSSINYIK